MTDLDTADVARIVRQLAALRVILGLDQRDVAAAIGTSQSRISYFETGRAVPSGRYLANWARVVGRRLALVDDEQTAKACLTPDDPSLPRAEAER